jgi:GntR family transcriptional regulator
MSAAEQSRERNVSKHEQIAAQLEERIRSSLHAHDPLPTERQLMKDFGVSRTTVRQAIQGLISSGLVYKIQGSGTYVADPAVISKTLRLTSFSEDMRQRGLEPASVVLASGTVAASPEMASVLEVEPGSPLVFVQRLRLADGRPMALESVYLLAELVDATSLDVAGSLYAQLGERGIRVERAAQTIGATNLDSHQARLLDQAVGAAAIRVVRVSYSDRGLAVERAETLYRADRYGFDVVVARD